MEKKTHYRKAFNSPYLSAADIVEPTVLTVAKVAFEPDKTKRTKENFNTVYFSEKNLPSGEQNKPMILNSGNNETMRIFAGGSKYLEEWVLGFKVTIFAVDNVRFGKDVVSGLRISTEQPITQKPDLKKNTPAWTNAVAAFVRDKNFDAIEKRMIVSEESKKAITKESGVDNGLA